MTILGDTRGKGRGQINFFIFKNVYIFCVYAFNRHCWLCWCWIGVFAVSWFAVRVLKPVVVSNAYGIDGVGALCVATGLFACWLWTGLVFCFNFCGFGCLFTADAAVPCVCDVPAWEGSACDGALCAAVVSASSVYIAPVGYEDLSAVFAVSWGYLCDAFSKWW